MISGWKMLVLCILLFAVLAAAKKGKKSTTKGVPKNKENAVEKDSDTGIDYCDSSLCNPGQKHVACNATHELHKKCSLSAELVVINNKLEKYIMKVINELRDKVAKGGFNGLSPAGRMGTLKWDLELAHLAEFNVLDCVMRTDECRNTKQFKNVGQTVGYRAVKGNIPELEDILKDILGVWMRENAGASMLDVMKYKKREKGLPKYNFLQIVTEDTEYVGCAILQQSRNHWFQTFFTCNFANAPRVGRQVYETGQDAAKACKSGFNPRFENLCSEVETYETTGSNSTGENKDNTAKKEDFVDDAAPPRIKARDGSPAGEGAPAPPAEGVPDDLPPPADGTTAAPEGGAAASTVTQAPEEASPAAEGATPAANSGSPGASASAKDDSEVEDILEHNTAFDKEVVQKNFVRFLMLMKRAEMSQGRRKIVITTSNHDVEDERTKKENVEDHLSLRTFEKAAYKRMNNRRARMRRSGIVGRSMHRRGRAKREKWRESQASNQPQLAPKMDSHIIKLPI
ncbi:uncharacterized protein LOC108109615 [Drosophila eugracilis]|uniref:uncharacterized protein LOC108109615 n=1 Tax=Drosophila eugracilis TaxID=29029 RepID=UPI001BDAC63C|nr:uncharacterized protein LOC108109615 [Drosophila eugracilis]